MAKLDLRSEKVVNTFKDGAGCVKCVRCSSEEPLLVSCGLDRFLRVYHLESRKMLQKVCSTSLYISPYGVLYLAIHSPYGVLYLVVHFPLWCVVPRCTFPLWCVLPRCTPPPLWCVLSRCTFPPMVCCTSLYIPPMVCCTSLYISPYGVFYLAVHSPYGVFYLAVHSPYGVLYLRYTHLFICKYSRTLLRQTPLRQIPA